MQLKKNSQNCLPENSALSDISIYKGNLTARNLVKNIAFIKKAFPVLPIDFYDLLTDRIKANNFSDERLNDAVNNVIDTCVYPQPTIAQFISFDKRIKVYDYSEYCKLCEEGQGKNYKPIKFKNRPAPVWIHINDIAIYNIKTEA